MYRTRSSRTPSRRAAIAIFGGLALLPQLARAAVARLVLDDATWRKRLAPEAYDVLRHEGTEAPFSSPLDHEKRRGTYFCAGCALPLFSSKTKYDSGTGWPSFWAPLPNAVSTKPDHELALEDRTEVHCLRCSGHLGHVFEDGPKPTGLRYCMNGVALAFKPSA
jgi:peptide-methionine (R)-S-oxide reductase